MDFPLGADQDVRLTRTIVPATRTEGFFSKDDVTRYSVKIEVGNFKRSKITIMVFDQVPKSAHNDVEIELQGTSPKPLAPPDVDGVLRWKLTIPPQQTREIVFHYEIERPTDFLLNQY